MTPKFLIICCLIFIHVSSTPIDYQDPDSKYWWIRRKIRPTNVQERTEYDVEDFHDYEVIVRDPEIVEFEKIINEYEENIPDMFETHRLYCTHEHYDGEGMDDNTPFNYSIIIKKIADDKNLEKGYKFIAESKPLPNKKTSLNPSPRPKHPLIEFIKKIKNSIEKDVTQIISSVNETINHDFLFNKTANEDKDILNKNPHTSKDTNTRNTENKHSSTTVPSFSQIILSNSRNVTQTVIDPIFENNNRDLINAKGLNNDTNVLDIRENIEIENRSLLIDDDTSTKSNDIQNIETFTVKYENREQINTETKELQHNTTNESINKLEITQINSIPSSELENTIENTTSSYEVFTNFATGINASETEKLDDHLDSKQVIESKSGDLSLENNTETTTVTQIEGKNLDVGNEETNEDNFPILTIETLGEIDTKAKGLYNLGAELYNLMKGVDEKVKNKTLGDQNISDESSESGDIEDFNLIPKNPYDNDYSSVSTTTKYNKSFYDQINGLESKESFEEDGETSSESDEEKSMINEKDNTSSLEDSKEVLFKDNITKTNKEIVLDYNEYKKAKEIVETPITESKNDVVIENIENPENENGEYVMTESTVSKNNSEAKYITDIEVKADVIENDIKVIESNTIVFDIFSTSVEPKENADNYDIKPETQGGEGVTSEKVLNLTKLISDDKINVVKPKDENDENENLKIKDNDEIEIIANENIKSEEKSIGNNETEVKTVDNVKTEIIPKYKDGLGIKSKENDEIEIGAINDNDVVEITSSDETVGNNTKKS